MTPLGEFCAQLERELRPLAAPLQHLRESVGVLPADLAPRAEALAKLSDLSTRLESILEKAAAQQAFMIVFGPLKSGKSTLMNALAGAYVSEVSSLPAYPCMVFVGDGPERRMHAETYDGTRTEFQTLDEMRGLLDRAHQELAATLREAEDVGRDLNPIRDLPQAIRRIDIRMPASPLAESGAMLVDTPGLYTRMRFGYDSMAREFRDKAASAIFVVKTENLFLEQIYDEFSDLLRLFSRIFLVVNLDTQKRDLGPDGQLAPSLEQIDPERIVEAFESLAMNAELRRAWEEGRLQIYPVDVQQAARRRLRFATHLDEPASDDGFAAFETDLLRYLSGHEFLQAFIRDTTRQADGILHDLGLVLQSGAMAELAVSAQQFEDASREAESRVRVAQDLLRHDWEKAFSNVRDEVRRSVGEQTAEIGPKSSTRAEAAVQQWYRGDRSLADLMRVDIAAIFDDSRGATVGIAGAVSREVMGSDVSAAMVRAEIEEAARQLDLPVGNIAREALALVEEPTIAVDLAPWIPLAILPVKRSFFDWIFLRTNAAVRLHLFGPEDIPAQRIPSSVKMSRLAEAEPVILQAVQQRLLAFMQESLSRATNEVLGRHVAAVCRALREYLATFMETESLVAGKARARAEELAGVVVEMEALAVVSARVLESLTVMGEMAEIPTED